MGRCVCRDGQHRHRAASEVHQGADALPCGRSRQVDAAAGRESDCRRDPGRTLCDAARRAAYAVRRNAGRGRQGGGRLPEGRARVETAGLDRSGVLENRPPYSFSISTKILPLSIRLTPSTWSVGCRITPSMWIFDLSEPPTSTLVPSPKFKVPMMFLSSRWMPRTTALALTPTEASAGHM